MLFEAVDKGNDNDAEAAEAWDEDQADEILSEALNG
jgi:hypothetical protein